MKRKARLACLVMPLALLAGCKTVGPNFTAPAPPTGDVYAAATTPASGLAASFGSGPEQRWWTVFGSPEMDALVGRALIGNHSLAASIATLERAQERVRAVAGRQLPQVDANARVEHEKVNLSAFGLDPSALGPGLAPKPFTLYSLGGGVSYDLDLFGGTRRAREQAEADAQALAREAEAAHLTIAGRVVVQVLTLAAINDRIATERALIAEDQRNVALTEAKRKGGEGTLVEVLSAQGQLAQDQAGLPQLEQQRAEGRDMLAILVGVTPAELGPTDFSLAAMRLPGQVPVTVPSELVHKRPDILAAEARLHSATAAIGVATAKLYPSVILGASFQQATTHPEDLLSGASNGFSILSGLTAPIFHGGTLKAERRGAEAETRAAAARYQQTLLEAFGQVSDLLAALGNDAEAVALRNQSASVAERSLGLSRRSFQVGYSGILQVLDASRGAQQARLAVVDARSRQFINVARLYVATAGGWTGPAGSEQAQQVAPSTKP
ncbi:MAG: efflux transporter outer membrane subunit [Novosphingobium sp.]